MKNTPGRVFRDFLTAISLALAFSPAWQTPASATEPAQDENLAYASGVQTYISGFPLMDLYRTPWETSFDPKRRHDRTPGIVYGEGGKVDIIIQHEMPSDPNERANWRPAPVGPFYLVLPHYSPQAAILTGD